MFPAARRAPSRRVSYCSRETSGAGSGSVEKLARSCGRRVDLVLPLARDQVGQQESTGGEVANALVCKTSIRGFNSRPVLQIPFYLAGPVGCLAMIMLLILL
jgi:hypothetical protein